MKVVCLVWMLFACGDAKSPEQVFDVGGEVKAPRVLTRAVPDYASCPADKAQSGNPILEMIVDADGRVRDPRLLKPIEPCFAKAILDSVRQWKFAPGTLHGKPVAVRMNMIVMIHYE